MLWNNIKSFQSTQKKHKLTFIFFHPDYTVGFGISPNHAFRLVGYTTGRELHPALKIVIQLRTIIISDIISVNKKFFSRLSKYNNLQAGKHRLFLNILLFGKLPVPGQPIPALILPRSLYVRRLPSYCNERQASAHPAFLQKVLHFYRRQSGRRTNLPVFGS